MDPVTRAALVFRAELDAFQRRYPGRVVPLVAEASLRGEMAKALRLAELDPANRRPLFLYEARFGDAGRYFEGFVDMAAEQYEAIRLGVAEERVSIPALSLGGLGDSAAQRAVTAAERIATALGGSFGGVLVAFVPEAVESGNAWKAMIADLSAIQRSPQVGIAVHSPPDGPPVCVLGCGGPRFEIDRPALVAYLKALGVKKSEGPRGSSGGLEACSAGERAAKLRSLLLDAAAASGAGQHAQAASHYREARAVCAAAGMATEEAMVLLGLAGACLAAAQPGLAVESYRRAAELAARNEAWQVAGQAWLGVAGVELAGERRKAAARSFRDAAEMAERGGAEPVRAEALRMAAACDGA